MFSVLYLTPVMVSTNELIAGVATLLTIGIGYTMAARVWAASISKRSSKMSLAGILFFTLVGPWISFSISFLLACMDMDPLSPRAYAFAYSWAVPVMATVWLILTLDHLGDNPWVKRALLAWMGVLDVIFFVAIYILEQYEVEDVEDSIFMNSYYTEIASWAVLFIALSVVLVVATVYFWAGQRTTRPLTRFRCRFIAAGAILYTVGAYTDGVVNLENLYQFIIVRFLILAALCCLFFGYTTPEWAKQRVLARSETSEKEL